jgi:hypothetical protein
MPFLGHFATHGICLNIRHAVAKHKNLSPCRDKNTHCEIYLVCDNFIIEPFTRVINGPNTKQSNPGNKKPKEQVLFLALASPSCVGRSVSQFLFIYLHIRWHGAASKILTQRRECFME